MRNIEFQKIVKKGDILVIQEGNTRETAGKRFKFVRFCHCQHMTNSSCLGCLGQITYQDLSNTYNSVYNREGCSREFNDPNIQDYLVIKADIMSGSEWIDDMEWEL